MAYDLKKFGSGAMDVGISPRTPDFSPDVQLATQTLNVSQGMESGLSVRCGMSPIPGQNDNETATLNPRLPGLLMSEGVPSIGLSSRVKVLGWVQLTLPSAADITQKVVVYGALVTNTLPPGTDQYLDVALCSTRVASEETISSFIYDGFDNSLSQVRANGGIVNSFAIEGVITKAGSKATTVLDLLKFSSSLFSTSFATINVTGSDIQMAYLFGKSTTNGDATHAPSTSFFACNQKYPGGVAVDTEIIGGIPSEYQLQNFKTAERSIRIASLTNEGAFNIAYSLLATPSASVFKQDLFENNTVNLDVAAIAATKDSAGTTYSATNAVLVNDTACSSNSSYSAVAVAAGSPYLFLFQGPFRSGYGKFNQAFDLIQNVWQPPTVASAYAEDGVNKSTCFAEWDVFITGSPFGGTVSPYGPALMGAGTGVLRKATTYEFTYSLYNKRLNYESNVGIPVKFNTGANDFVGLQLWNAAAGGGNETQYFHWRNTAPAGHWMPFYFGSFQDNLTKWYPPNLATNFCEYRFYYRQLGTFEWLPAGNVDAAQFWFDGFLALNVCLGPVAATPGGQPGGFNDYSPLPADNYNCVVQYKNRFFWFSDKACVFSLANNIFAYAGRNSISASTGKFLGGIVHNYPGQAEQSSRLIIFGTDGNYVARFTGLYQQTQVQVSADTSATFNIEGSDLVIDPWTNVTAFSYRTAAIANGILYYWGPQGIYRDDGVATPTKISPDLEPYIFTLYDPNDTQNIHAHYDDLTKEITWFYRPKTADSAATHTLVYNVLTEKFIPGSSTAKIDWTQSLNVESNMGTAGKRTLIGSRASGAATVQRSYFFDNRNRSGDMYPTTDWLIKSVTTPVAGSRRLTLAGGYNATNFAAISIGDYLALQQAPEYSNGFSCDDMIAKITAVNTGSGYVDILLPTGATMAASLTPTFDKYFPFWQRTPTAVGQNGIPYVIQTTYWTPTGINGYYWWLYWYLLAKMRLWATDVDIGWQLAFRGPTALDFITDPTVFQDNSDGNFQLYHPLRRGNDNMEGQGLKLKLSDAHIGHEWVLQYMEIHGTPYTDGDILKQFEG